MIKEKVWVEISKTNLQNNLKLIKEQLSYGTKFGVCIKANAYGHGFLEVASIISDTVDIYCVDSFEEAIKLKEIASNKDVYVMGFIDDSNLEETIKSNIEFVCYDLKMLNLSLRIAKKLKIKAKVHLKIETGTNRQGILPIEVPLFIELFKQSNYLTLQGICTHFANIEDTTDHKYAFNQVDKFNIALKYFEESKIMPKNIHIGNSATTLLYPNLHFNMVRVGLISYGMWPSTETIVSLKNKSNLIDIKPVLTWKTKLAQVKHVKKGQLISYGCTYKTLRDSVIGVVPVGYYDGFDRKISNSGHVLINGTKAPVVGRVCMNMFMIDITDIPNCKKGDEIVLLGRQSDNELSAEEMAGKIGTINYEVTTRINPLIKRIIID